MFNENELWLDPLLLIAAFIFFALSFAKFQNQKFTMALIFIMIAGFLLRFYISMDLFLHEWDERYHALVAKNLISNPLMPTLYNNPILDYDYRSWTSNHIWLHKQPLSLWTLACSMWLFGTNEIALRLPSIFLSTLGIYLTYYIASYFYNKRVAYFACFLFTINGLILEMTGGRATTDHVDIHFLFYIELAIVFSILFAKHKKTFLNILAGISIGLAILTKWLPALIVIPIWLIIVSQSGSLTKRQIFTQLAVLILCIVLIALPWQIFILQKYPMEASLEYSYNSRHLTEVIEGHDGTLLFYLNQIRINYGELIYLPLAWFIFNTIKKKEHSKHLVIIVWFLIPFLFFTCVKTKMQGYLLFTAPTLFIITALFFFWLLDYRLERKERAIKIVGGIILALLVLVPIRYSFERLKIHDRNIHAQWAMDLKKAKIANGSILFNYKRPVEAMFYKNIVAYPFIPNEEIVTELLAKKMKIVLVVDNPLPPFLDYYIDNGLVSTIKL